MSETGKLSDRPLPDLLHGLFSSTTTGHVKLVSRMGSHSLFVRDGYPVAVVLPGSAEMIGKVLLEMGIIDEAIYRKSMMAPPPPGKRYGDLLIEKNWVTAEQLRLALKAQTRRKLHRLFFLNDGQWTLEPGAHDQGLHGQESLRVHPYRAIYHGVRSAWGPDRLQGALFLLEGRAIKLKVTPEEAARYGFGVDDGRVAELLRKGYWVVNDLVEGSGLPAQAVHALVYAFYITEALDIQAADSVPRLKRKAGEPPLVTPTSVAASARTEISGAWQMPSGTFTMPQPTTPKSILRPNMTPPSGVNLGGGHTPAGGTPLPDIDGIRKQIELKAKVVESENLFDVLGLQPSATRDEIKNAYFEAAKRYHPDRLVSMGLESRRPEVEKIFRRVSEAYGTLYDDMQREVYKQQLGKPKNTDDSEAHAKAMRMLEAEMAFRRGEILLRKNDYAGAIVEFESAVKSAPQEGEHLAYLTWARVCAGQITHAIARPTLQQAVKLSPKCARAHYYYGLCLKEENDIDRAYHAFRQAQELDARLLEAEREMRLINMRREKAKEKGKGGFFNKLLKK